MLNLKKVIASICVIALMLSTVAFAANYSDVAEDSAYYEAVETLSKLGIVTGYEDGSYKPEATVTRAEMAALVARIQGYEEVAKASAATIFTDVAKEHWASGYVAQAANQGIINGYGDGTFGPDDAVTYEQAVKMIMATLGYTPYANFNGGYPTGYLTAATRYGVSKGVSNAVVGTGANRGTIAQLLNNAIDTALMVQNNWSTNGEVNYVVYDGVGDNEYKTLMSEYLGVVKLKGIVVENSVVDLAGVKSIKTDKEAEVEVYVTDNFKTENNYFSTLDTEYTFLVGESDAEEFIGKAVVLYVVEVDDDEYEVVAIAEDSARNDVITFNLDQFAKIENNRIYYFETVGDEDAVYEAYEKGTGSAAPVFVYNGKGGLGSMPAVVANNGLSVNGGSITLIDNDSVKGPDYIFVEVAATAVVDEVVDGTVTFKEPAEWDSKSLAEIEFELIGDNTVIELTKDGEAFDYADLKEWDALSIIASNDNGKGYIRAEVVSNAIEGKITASNKSVTSYNNVAFTIDGKKYDVIEGFGTTTLEVGDAGTFYIDKYGKIAAFNENSAVESAAGSYAYILKMIADEDSMGDKELVFLLLTADGIKEVNVANRVKVNYSSDNSDTLVVADMTLSDPVAPATDAAAFFSGKDVAVDTVVKYTLNSAGDINTITTADHSDKFTRTSIAVGDYTYNADKGHLGKFVDSDSIVFFIDGTKKSVVGSLADLADETEYEVAKIYADSKADENNIIVINGGLENIAPSATAAIITDIASGLDEEGASIITLSYVQDGKEVTGVSTVEDYDDSDVIGTLTIGDVVKVKVNAAGNITKIKTVIDFTEGGRMTAADFDSYVDGWASNDGLEELVGGPVTWAKKGAVSFKSASSAYGNSAWTTGTYYTPSKDLATDNLHNLAKADTISVIEFKSNGSVAVKAGTASSFKLFEALYNNEDAASKIYDAEALAAATTDGEIAAAVVSTEDGTLDAIEAYTDHVFCRYYDGELVEVVIVKAPLDIRVK